MNRFLQILVCLLALCAPLWITGCGACPRALAVYTTADGLADEASQRLGQVESLLAIANLPADTKSQLASALSKAHDGLAQAIVSMRTLKEACESGANLPDAFRTFNAAWAVIRQFIPVIAAIVGTHDGGQVTISDPTVFRIQ